MHPPLLLLLLLLMTTMPGQVLYLHVLPSCLYCCVQKAPQQQ
jgi:hypothetical protein